MEAVSSLPVWAQSLFAIITVIGTASVGLMSYIKKEAKSEASGTPTAGTNSVISASFIESKLLRELVEALREHQDESGRDSKKTHRLLQDLREATNENTEALIVQTDSTMNLVRFVNRRAASAGKLSLTEGD